MALLPPSPYGGRPRAELHPGCRIVPVYECHVTPPTGRCNSLHWLESK